jgi:1D-myo-inositol 3-kinase
VTILFAGHYCHDTLLRKSGQTRALGGSASYASAVFDAFGVSYDLVAKVGADFAYLAQVSKPPIVTPGRTTSFVDDYRSGERVEHCEAVCEAIAPEDLPNGRYDVGMACAISGEVGLPVLRRMREMCGVLIADAQGLLREIAPNGDVLLRPMPAEVPLDLVKASVKEAALLDVPKLRKRMRLLITDGERGCRLLTASDEILIPAFPAAERDPTGAGDCFLAGVAVGLERGLPLPEAARLGAWCGARAVESIGVPRIDPANSP